MAVSHNLRRYGRFAKIPILKLTAETTEGAENKLFVANSAFSVVDALNYIRNVS